MYISYEWLCCCRSYSLLAFAEFRERSLTEIAAAYARASDLQALSWLTNSCPYSLMPQLLDILLSVPETVPIQEIVSFIQKVLHPKLAACFSPVFHKLHAMGFAIQVLVIL